MGTAVLLGGPMAAVAAELPAHDPMRILIVGDEVNPHGLSDQELTQPDDLRAAIADPGSGLNVAQVELIDSACVDDALGQLDAGVDVVVYFAHEAATACDGSPRQAELTAAFEGHLRAGGGVVVFHHGIYEAGGKESILQLLGGRASSVAWDTAAGQDVIAVGGDHFVTSQGMQYSGMRSFSGVGVAAGDYPFFNNTPDERYDAMALLTEPGEERTILFTSADSAGGSARVLGYDLWRPGWVGHVVWWQPGEYQPVILDLAGNDFQALANSIVYVAITEEDPGSTTGADTGMMPSDDTGAVDSGGDGSTSDAGATSEAGSESDGTGTGAALDGDGGGGGGKDGCGCQSSGGGAAVLGLPLLVLGGLVRRRRRG